MTDSSTATNGRVDAAQVKAAAAGRWREILPDMAGIPREHLDGRSHPCPWCGGKDRFRLIDEQVGAVLCNQCFSSKNGDGIAAVQHAMGCGFVPALRAVANCLDIRFSNGNGAAMNPLDALARIKGVSAEGLNRYGAIVTDGKVWVPMFDAAGVQCSSVNLSLRGKDFNEKGKKVGLFFPTENGQPRLPAEGESWLVLEGPKDCAKASEQGWLATGLPGAGSCHKHLAAVLKGCNVTTCLDRDNAGEKNAKKIARLIHGIATTVKIAVLPVEFSATDGKDLRDAIREIGVEAVQTALDDATEWSDDGVVSAAGGLIKAVADEIGKDDFFAKDPGGKLYRYSGGVYRRRGEDFIRSRVKRILHTWASTSLWNKQLNAEIIEWIKIDAPELWECPPLDIVNVQNGLLRVDDRKLLPHSPDHLSPVQLPVKYDPDATCPATDKFDSEVFPADAIDLASEIPGWLMVPHTSIQKALLLIGEGGNGKSRKLEQIRAFLGGRANVSGSSLHRLEKERFSVGSLVGKLANICPDLPSTHLAGTSVFKACTGGDVLTAEYKFLGEFDFVPFSRLVFSANHPPRSETDDSEGFFDRWVVIKFDARFRGTDQEIPAGELDARLQSPAELSGLLNHALDGLDRIKRQRGLSNPLSVRDAHDEFRSATDPLAVWLDQATVDDPEAVLPKVGLRVAYGDACRDAGRSTPSNSRFGSLFKKHRPAVSLAQRTVNGRLQWCYVGIGLRESAAGTSQT